MHKLINSPFEKCLDCWNYKKLQGSYRCIFGLTPVMLREEVTEGKKTKTVINCVCHGYYDHGENETAPARKELLRRIRKYMRRNK